MSRSKPPEGDGSASMGGRGSSDLRRAIVVGASRGLGKAVAEALRDGGAQVLATVRTMPDIEPAPRGIRFLRLDVNEPAGDGRLRDAMPDESCDLLFLNAGILGPAHQSAAHATAAETEALFATNAVSPVRLARAALPLVRPGGVVAFMSSRTGSIALNDDGALELYRASKAALNALARSFAVRDALPQGKGVLMLHPGWVRTDMGGDDAPVSVAASVAGMLAVIRDALGRPAHRFLDYQGTPIPW